MQCSRGPLEELTELIGAAYLSDLRTMDYYLICRQLRNMEPDKYTLFQWQDAARYLTGQETKLETVKEIYDYLLSY